MTEEEKKQVISDHYREIQARGVIKRLAKDPNTYKKMIGVRWEKAKENELEIKVEVE